VKLGVRNSETTDEAKDGGKKSVEVPSAREKVKETRNPKLGVNKKKTCKVKVDRVKSYGASWITT
jgi:ASC-1-like (ASCH) protein